MAISDTQIKKAKATDKLQKLSDSGGLQLHIATTGGKLWRWAYRFDGKQKTMGLGTYPAVSLADARAARDNAKKLLAAGADPMQDRKNVKLARLAASEHSFESVARQWFDHWKGPKNVRHAGYVLARLEADVFPAIGPKPVAEIVAPDLVKMVKAIEARGALDIAKRCLQMTGQVFRYAIAH